MVEACTKSIICPNKQMDPVAKFTPRGHLLESETYIGGKVECLETGVYRSDIEYKFDMRPEGFQGLIDNVDRDITFAIEVEGGIDRSKITNYDEVRDGTRRVAVVTLFFRPALVHHNVYPSLIPPFTRHTRSNRKSSISSNFCATDRSAWKRRTSTTSTSRPCTPTSY